MTLDTLKIWILNPWYRPYSFKNTTCHCTNIENDPLRTILQSLSNKESKAYLYAWAGVIKSCAGIAYIDTPILYIHPPLSQHTWKVGHSNRTCSLYMFFFNQMTIPPPTPQINTKTCHCLFEITKVLPHWTQWPWMAWLMSQVWQSVFSNDGHNNMGHPTGSPGALPLPFKRWSLIPFPWMCGLGSGS